MNPKPQNRQLLSFITLSACLLMGHLSSGTAWGQTWSVNQSPINSVPQYIPRYPLGDAAAVKKPLPKPQPNAPAVNVNVAPKPTATTPIVVKRQPVKPPAKKPVAKKPAAKKPAAKKSTAKKAKDAKAKKEPKKTDPHYGVDYSVHRDRNMYPIDPRKPCSTCVRPRSLQKCCSGCGGKLLGNQGQPYMETEPGGCTCQKKRPTHHPNFSIHWPRPFSAWLDERHPEQAAARYAPCQEPRCIDSLNHLSKLKLSKYARTDNGHTGVGSDPYGCLSESKQGMRIPASTPMYFEGAGFESVGVQAAGFETVVGSSAPSVAHISGFGRPSQR